MVTSENVLNGAKNRKRGVRRFEKSGARTHRQDDAKDTIFSRRGKSDKRTLLPKMKESYLKSLEMHNKSKKFRTVKTEGREAEPPSIIDDEKLIRELYDHILLDTRRIELWHKMPKSKKRKFKKGG